MANVLIVEDEDVLARSIARSLSNIGHDVIVSRTLEEGEQAFVARRPDLALLDMELPDGDGLDLLARWAIRDPELRVLVMTAHADPEYSARALKLGAHACVRKPMDLNDLAGIVMAVLADTESDT
jgi:DNA-binding response OmpR family regulator